MKHLCIVGTGAAGWLACNLFKAKDYIQNITIIGSAEIPPIGVGESNTLKTPELHSKIGLDNAEFIRETDAAIKYGVFYRNWSRKDFLHFFKGPTAFDKLGLPEIVYGKAFGSKPTDIPIEDYFGKRITEITSQNLLFSDPEELHPLSWHFDAGKYISYLTKEALKSYKVNHLTDTVVDCKFNSDEITSVVMKSGLQIHADYFIFASGNSDLVRNILKEEYVDLSNVLLTNKAIVYPLEYTNKREQFHPYTVAKTMRCGWRWITPTYSRIGTGYVFSDKHISVDEAVDEFLSDIGDKTLSPRVVDFYPRYNKKTFKKNYCTLGMLNGFLEPLDAPGLSMTGDVLIKLEKYFEFEYSGDESFRRMHVDHMNAYIEDMYKFWASFILAQYKTCHRNDSQFWVDHKNVEYDFYKNIIKNLNNYTMFNSSMMMFYHTLAGKDFQWGEPLHLAKFDDSSLQPAEHHLDFIEQVHKYSRA